MLIAFSVTPLGVGEGVGEIVAEAVRVVRASGLPNRTDSMFTTIEGDGPGTCCERLALSSGNASPMMVGDLRWRRLGWLRYRQPDGCGGDGKPAQFLFALY